MLRKITEVRDVFGKFYYFSYSGSEVYGEIFLDFLYGSFIAFMWVYVYGICLEERRIWGGKYY